MASLTAPPPRPVLRQGFGDATASSHPSVAIMEAARRKREEAEAEAKRKADIDAAQEARAEEALKLSQNADQRAAAAAKLAQEQEKREAAAGVRAQEEAVAKRAPGDLALEVAAYDIIPESTGKPFAQQPRYTKQTLIDKYGAAAATGWDEAMRNYTGDKTLGKTPAPTPVAGQTVQQDEKGNVTVTTTGPKAEDNVSPKELADLGGDPTGLTPAERNKAAARLRMAEREAAAAKDKTMPASSVEKLTAFQEIADLSKVMAEQVSKLKSGDIGPIDTGVAKVKRFMGYDPEQGLGANSPGYNEAMNTYNTVRNIILRARSGGAVTPSEADRLLSELGDPATRAGTFVDDINNFARNRMADVQLQREALQAAGYKVPETPKKSDQPNITQEDYAKLKKGEKFWWNGAQLTKD